MLLLHHPAPPPPSASAVTAGPEAGTGLLATTAALGAFVLFLLAAVQVALDLSATTAVSAAGYDAARVVASRLVDHADPSSIEAAERRGEERFHRLLGRSAVGAALVWSVDEDAVHLHVRLATPTVLPSTAGHVIHEGTVDRTFVVRVEAVR